MKEIYEKNIIEKVKNILKINDSSLSIEVKKYGEKITVDGIEFFNKIETIVVKHRGYDVVYYNVEKNSLAHPRHIKNIYSAKYTVKIVNTFLGEERIKLPKSIDADSYIMDDMLLNLSEQEMYDAYGIIL